MSDDTVTNGGSFESIPTCSLQSDFLVPKVDTVYHESDTPYYAELSLYCAF